MYILTLKITMICQKLKSKLQDWMRRAQRELHPKGEDTEALAAVSSGKWNYKEERVKNRASIFMFHVLLCFFSLQ